MSDPRNLAEHAELVRAAEASDESTREESQRIAHAALQRARERIDAKGKVSRPVWSQMAPELRQVLLTLCTDRKDVESACYMPWCQFTPDERAAIGATARTFRRQLELANWLR